MGGVVQGTRNKTRVLRYRHKTCVQAEALLLAEGYSTGMSGVGNQAVYVAVATHDAAPSAHDDEQTNGSRICGDVSGPNYGQRAQSPEQAKSGLVAKSLRGGVYTMQGGLQNLKSAATNMNVATRTGLG